MIHDDLEVTQAMRDSLREQIAEWKHNGGPEIAKLRKVQRMKQRYRYMAENFPTLAQYVHDHDAVEESELYAEVYEEFWS